MLKKLLNGLMHKDKFSEAKLENQNAKDHYASIGYEFEKSLYSQKPTTKYKSPLTLALEQVQPMLNSGVPNNELVGKVVTSDKSTFFNSDYFGLYNPSTGLGTSRDPNTTFARTDVPILTFNVLDVIYRTSPIATKVVDTIPYYACNKWRIFKHSNPEYVKKRQEAEEKYLVKKRVMDAMKWANLYGGAAILPITKSAERDRSVVTELPYSKSELREGCLQGFNVVIKDVTNPMGFINLDVLSTNYITAQTYFVMSTNNSLEVSSERLIFFYGKELPLFSRIKQLLWGDSIVAQCLHWINQAEDLVQNISVLVGKSTIDVIKKKSVYGDISDDLQKFMNDARIRQQYASNFNETIVDIDEDVERKQLDNLEDLVKVLEFILQLICSVIRVPLSVFLGSSVGGFSSGDNEIIMFRDEIVRVQHSIEEQIKEIDSIIEHDLFGKEVGMEYEWVDLAEMTDSQLSTARLQDAQRDQIYFQEGVLDPKVIGERLKDEGVYPTLDTSILEDEPMDMSQSPEMSTEQSRIEADTAVKPSDAKGSPN